MPKGRKPSRQEKLAHLDAALAYVQNFRTAIDAGAHWGLWSEVMAKRFKAVKCFEPLPENIEELTKRMEPFQNVDIFGWALGEQNGNGTLVDPIKAGGHSKHYVDFKGGKLKVRTIDGYHFQDVDFIKTDCEGADLLVLKGAADTIRRCEPVIIMERMPPFEARYGVTDQAVVNFMDSNGYKLVEHHWRDDIWVCK